MRSASPVAQDAAFLRDWLGRGVKTEAPARFKSGTPTVAASGSISQTTSSESVSGILVRLDREEGRAQLSGAAPLAGGVVGVDAVFWVENASSGFDARTQIVVGSETFEVCDIATWPGMTGTSLLYLRRRK